MDDMRVSDEGIWWLMWSELVVCMYVCVWFCIVDSGSYVYVSEFYPPFFCLGIGSSEGGYFCWFSC